MKQIIEQINKISEDIEIKSSEIPNLKENVRKSEEKLNNSEANKNLLVAKAKLECKKRKIDNLKSLRELLTAELLSGCKHTLLYDEGYYKNVCGKYKISATKENAEYRNLRCICCEKAIVADRNSEYFHSDENVIANSRDDFRELHELYMSELLEKTKKYKN